MLNDWQERGWRPILFGGFVRDIAILGRRYYPRDVDVVLINASTEDIMREFHPQSYHLNRFGGLRLDFHRWAFDVWPLEKTWAFTVDTSLAPIVENLPKTTFLDVEAVAVTLREQGKIERIYAHGFFEAVDRGCIGIGYRENPFPALCAIRAMIIACKLRYKVSSGVARYFVQAVREHGASELVNAQDIHYKRVLFRKPDISILRTHFTKALDEDGAEEISLPDIYDPVQLNLWHD
jgi:hypothetical protein